MKLDVATASKRRCAGWTDRLLASVTDAVEAIDGWWQSPRHAAFIEYRDAATSAHRARALRGWHVTVAQAYDWMWRHYRYRPPGGDDSFTDTLGQKVSHVALRAAIRAAREAGIATLAYGSVYGAEREFVDRYPDDRVFDATGEALSLGGTFFINDVRPGTHWRRTLLSEYERAMRHLPFAGIHMDTYGPPWTAIAADGTPISFRELYPGLIEEAAGRVARIRDGRVLFNCVEGFPLEDVATAPMSALYLELWPPDDRYRHVVDWIDRAHRVADGRAVVIAAYALALRTAVTAEDRRRAVESSLLLDAVILAAGAYPPHPGGGRPADHRGLLPRGDPDACRRAQRAPGRMAVQRPLPAPVERPGRGRTGRPWAPAHRWGRTRHPDEHQPGGRQGLDPRP